MKPVSFLRLGACSAAAAGVVLVAACANSAVSQKPLSWSEADRRLAQPTERLVQIDAAETRARAAETNGIALSQADAADAATIDDTPSEEGGALSDEDGMFTSREERGSTLALADDVPVLTNVDGPLRVQADGETYRLSRRDETRPAEDTSQTPDLSLLDDVGAPPAGAMGDVGYGSAGGGAPLQQAAPAVSTGVPQVGGTNAGTGAPPGIDVSGEQQRARAAEQTGAAEAQAPQQQQGPLSSSQAPADVPADFDGAAGDLPGVIDDPAGVNVPELPDNSVVFGPAIGATGLGNTTGVGGAPQLPIGAGGVAQVPSAGVGAGDQLARETATNGRQTAEQLATPPGQVQPRQETVDQLATPPRYRTQSPGPGIVSSTQPQSIGGADPITGGSTTSTVPRSLTAPLSSSTGAGGGALRVTGGGSDRLGIDATGLPVGRHSVFLLPQGSCGSIGGVSSPALSSGTRIGEIVVDRTGASRFVESGRGFGTNDVSRIAGREIAVSGPGSAGALCGVLAQ